MSLYFKIILVIFGLAYFISPVDVIPDLLLPYFGWIADGVVLATIIYMIRYGRLPNFLFNRKNPFQPPKDKPNPYKTSGGPSNSCGNTGQKNNHQTRSNNNQQDQN